VALGGEVENGRERNRGREREGGKKRDGGIGGERQRERGNKGYMGEIV